MNKSPDINIPRLEIKSIVGWNHAEFQSGLGQHIESKSPLNALNQRPVEIDRVGADSDQGARGVESPEHHQRIEDV